MYANQIKVYLQGPKWASHISSLIPILNMRVQFTGGLLYETVNGVVIRGLPAVGGGVGAKITLTRAVIRIRIGFKGLF